jgi:hypothetical protein
LEEISEYEEAIFYYRRVVEIMPYDYYGELAQRRIVEIYVDFLNDIPMARKELQRYSELYPAETHRIEELEEKIRRKEE